jgi:hypothetical protein
MNPERNHRKKVQFFTFRYLPNVSEDRFVNFGIVVFSPPAGARYCRVRFLEDWSTVTALDPNADVDMLKAVADDLRENLLNKSTRAQTLKTVRESLSNTIQLSNKQSILTSNIARDIIHKHLQL